MLLYLSSQMNALKLSNVKSHPNLPLSHYSLDCFACLRYRHLVEIPPLRAPNFYKVLDLKLGLQYDNFEVPNTQHNFLGSLFLNAGIERLPTVILIVCLFGYRHKGYVLSLKTLHKVYSPNMVCALRWFLAYKYIFKSKMYMSK